MRALFGSFASLGLLALLLLPAVPALSGCDSGGEEPVTCTDPVAFDIEDITPDGTQTGAMVEDLACASVTYIGRFPGGESFDEGTGLAVYIGQGSRVIDGLWLGLREQRVGETRRLTIPPSLGYRNQDRLDRDGNVVIPACSVLEFDVTVDDLLPLSACTSF